MLIKIILDFIRYNETTSIPVSFLKILKKNEILFFKTFKELEIYSIKELLSFLFLLNQNTFENEELFKLILKKIEILLSNDYITIDNYFWRNFLESMPIKYIPDIKKLLNNLVEDLIFRFELDKQIRNEKYSIEIKKYNQLNEFKIICDDLISISV